MRKSYFILYGLLLLFVFAACSSDTEVIDKFPALENKYNPSQPTAANEILPNRGIIDQTFIINGNFPGDLSEMKVYFGTKQAVITATDGISITGLVPKQPEGLNQISLVLGNDSIVPEGMLFKYKQSRSVKTIAGKLGEEKWMDDADYAGAALDAVTFGEISFVATVAGQTQDNIIASKANWNESYLFLLSQDDNKIQKLSTPEMTSSPAVNSTRDAFYVTRWWDGNRTIYYFSKVNSWEYNTTGIIVTSSDLPGKKVCSMTFAEDDNLLYLMDTDGRIAEVNLHDKAYKVYTSAAKKPNGINAANYGGEIKGDLPTEFGDWHDAFLCYSKYHQCFFATFARQHAIYKLEKNPDDTWTSTLYAGNNGMGITVGDRLVDAKFTYPYGIVVNEDGEIFVTNKGECGWCSKGHVILKISGDIVELVAGKTDSHDPLVNGDPLEATFDVPLGMAIDSDGNYIIAGGEDRTIRKLSIE